MFCPIHLYKSPVRGLSSKTLGVTDLYVVDRAVSHVRRFFGDVIH